MIFELNDLKLHYKQIGEGQPVLMLHGMPTDHRAMMGAFEPIFSTKSGWRRVYLDLPAMGKTTGGEWIDSNDAVLDVLCQFIETQFKGERFLLAGFSYGGYLARGVLHRYSDQIDGMMLIAPVVPGERDQRQLPPQVTLTHNPEGMAQFPERVRELLSAVLVVQDDDVLARQYEVIAGVQVADHEKVGQIAANYPFSFAVDQLPEPFTHPVLIVTGRHDSVTGYEDPFTLVPTYPRATYATLDRAGHGVHMEQPQLFNALVDEWLQRVVEMQKM